jgi:hypothetical protein
MAITAAQTQRTEALHIDVGLKYYTAVAADVTATDITQDAAFSPDGSWTEITAIVTEPTRFNETLDEQGVTLDFQATVNGIKYNSTTLERGRLMLAMHRLYSVASGWTGWTVWWCGYISAVQPAADDHDQMGRWTANIRSLRFLLERADAPAHSFGRTNLAASGSATASSTLTTVVSEAGKGEFLGIPSVAASNAIDGNLDTLWISNGAPSPTAETPASGGSDLCINEVYREPTGWDAGYRWIELYHRGTGDDDSIADWRIVSESVGELDMHDAMGSYSMAPGDHLILCANQKLFSELFDPGDAPVVDWRHIGAWGTGGAGKDWTYDPDGDYLYLITPEAAIKSVVRWGTGGDVVVSEVDYWNGDAVAAWTAGASITRAESDVITAGYQASDEEGIATDWAENDYPSPGRHYVGDESDWEWLSVDLGEYAWTLTAEITGASTTITVTPNTDGLTKSGSIITDDDSDVIAYTNKTATTLTGVTGIGSTHAAGVAFSQYENEAATNQVKLGGCEWKRRHVPFTAGSKPVPSQFAIWYSTAASPEYPPTEDWKLDWTRVKGFTQSYNSFEWMGWRFEQTEADGTRPRGRHVMITIRKMGDDGRAKINEFKVYADETTTATEFLQDIDTATIIEHLLIDHYGLASGQVSVTEGARMGPFSTQKDNYVRVLEEICKRTGTILHFRRDLKVYVIADPMFPLHGGWDLAYTLDKQAACDLSVDFSYPDNVGQIQLTARCYDHQAGEDHVFEVSWPQTALDGEVRRVAGESIVGSEQEAYQFAEAHFRRARAATRVTLKASGITDEWCRPTTNVALTWDMDAAGTTVDFNGNLFLVTAIDVTAHSGHPRKYDETVSLVEYIP